MLLILPLLLVTSVPHQIHAAENTSTGKQTAQQYTPFSRITIQEDSQFSNLFPGNGTENNPYLIERLNITNPTSSIQIMSTRAHFVIRNCWLTSEYVTVGFTDVKNGRIENCRIMDANQGVWITNCTDITIENTWISGCDDGILINWGADLTIENCRIDHNQIGLEQIDTNRTLIENNTIYGNRNRGAVIGLNSHNNSIIDNRIGWNGGLLDAVPVVNGFDRGINSLWESNRWSDYDGVGVYEISGGANANDSLARPLVDTILPELSDETDIVYIRGETGNVLSWSCSDEYPFRYVIYRNSETHRIRNWYGNDISINVDNLNFGAYNFTIVVRDAAGNEVSHSLYVHVTMDMFGGQATVIILGGSVLSVFVVLVTIVIVKARK